MALKPRFSTGLRNAMLGTEGIGAVFAAGTLKVYTGAQPANADAAPTGTLLLTITLPNPAFAAAAAGSRAKAGSWSGTAAATGTAGWFRIATSADGGALSTTDKRIDGEVGTTGADLNLATVAVTTSDVITVDSFAVSIPVPA